MSDFIIHSGVGHEDNPPGRGSGRYGWGTGENPYQHHFNFLSEYRRMKKNGMTDALIAEAMIGEVTDSFGKTRKANSSDIRNMKAIAETEIQQIQYAKIVELWDKFGESPTKVAKELTKIDPTGKVWTESSVRSLLKPIVRERSMRYENTAELIKKKIEEYGIVDVGAYTEINMGVTDFTKKVALDLLQKQGYVTAVIRVPQSNNPNQQTELKVIAKPGMSYDEIYKAVIRDGQIGTIVEYSPDKGKTFWAPEFPSSLDSKRVFVRYGDEEYNGITGKDMDGVVQLRKGVEDISLGGSLYAQVRIAVDGTHYMKGMAVYSDDIPDGYDVIYNTNKPKGTPVLGSKDNTVMKPLQIDKATGEVDRNNPFGANIKAEKEDEDGGLITAGGQRHYIDQNGNDQLSPINKLREEGDWEKWSKKLSSQFLAKQPIKLLEQQIDLSIKDRQLELDDIRNLTNSTVKKKLLMEYADACELNAADLKTTGYKNQRFQVILPVPSLKDNECYAPNYSDGEELALIRFPHAGLFEIPIVKNNTRNKAAKSFMENAGDAIGVNSAVAEQLSGADFDGDTVLAIPMTSNNIRVASQKPLQELKNWDFHTIYKLPEGKKAITEDQKQAEMGKATNLVTDMTAAGAPIQDIVKAVKHTMVVIDSVKHRLDINASFRDNDIQRLKETFQKHTDVLTGKESMGASTIFSRANAKVRTNERKEVTATYKMTPEEVERYNKGEKIYRDTEKYIRRPVKNPDLMTPEELKLYNAGKPVYRTSTDHVQVKVPTMYLVDDAMKLVRNPLNKKEVAYAQYANTLKGLALEARSEARAIKPEKTNPSATRAYRAEVDSLTAKLVVAQSNSPKERVATVVSGSIATQQIRSNPDWGSEQKKKARGQAMIRARAMVGAKKTPVSITDREWEAIQANAISTNKLSKILLNANPDRVRQLATPKRSETSLSQAQLGMLQSMLASGMYTQKDIADRLGVSVSTVSKYAKAS